MHGGVPAVSAMRGSAGMPGAVSSVGADVGPPGATLEVSLGADVGPPGATLEVSAQAAASPGIRQRTGSDIGCGWSRAPGSPADADPVPRHVHHATHESDPRTCVHHCMHHVHRAPLVLESPTSVRLCMTPARPAALGAGSGAAPAPPGGTRRARSAQRPSALAAARPRCRAAAPARWQPSRPAPPRDPSRRRPAARPDPSSRGDASGTARRWPALRGEVRAVAASGRERRSAHHPGGV